MKHKAGAFLAKGADTCVYAPPVMCTAESGPNLSGDTTKVSRIVQAVDPEIATQDRLKAILTTIPPFIQKYFMVYDTKCVPEFREEDTTEPCATNQAVVREGLVGPRPNLTNLITKKFTLPFMYLQDSPRNRAIALRDLAVATMYLFDDQSNTVLHMDPHVGNIAVIEDQASYYMALNDWGRSLVVNVNAPDVHGQLKADANRNPIYNGDIDSYVLNVNTNAKYWFRYITRAWRHMVETNNPRWGGFAICINVLGILGTWAAAFPQQLHDIDAAYVYIGTQFGYAASSTGELKERVVQRLNQIPLLANPVAAPPPAVAAFVAPPPPPPAPAGAPIAAPPPPDFVAVNVAPPGPGFVAVNVAPSVPGGRKRTRRHRKSTRGSHPRSGGRGPKHSRSSRRVRSHASYARSHPSAS